MPSVYIPAVLRSLTGGRSTVEVAGATVREVIDNLEQAWPGMRERLVDQDRLRPNISVAVDGEVSPMGLLEPVQESSEVHFVAAIKGGRVLGSLAVLVLLLGGGARADTGPWDVKKLRTAPAVSWVETSGPQRSLFYENEPYRGRPTRVFAYYALPERRNGKVPAMVLVHGGGGKAFPEWATLWAQRGYAAIAMDLSGRGPDGQRHADAGPDQTDKEKFHGLAEGVREAWSYHAIAAIFRAASFLEAQPEVDGARLGITGISWGGYLTSLAAGLDDRLKAAIPVYGCGFLHENSVWKPLLDRMPEAVRSEWVRHFDPSRYLAQARLPMLWINGTNDFAYPLDSYQKSYQLPRGPRTLRVTVNMPHGHPQGWEPLEIYLFADQVLRQGTALPVLGPLERKGRAVRVKVTSATPVIEASLHFTTSENAWHSRRWISVPARVGTGAIEAELPDERPLTYFLTAGDNRGALLSTEHEEIRP